MIKTEKDYRRKGGGGRSADRMRVFPRFLTSEDLAGRGRAEGGGRVGTASAAGSVFNNFSVRAVRHASRSAAGQNCCILAPSDGPRVWSTTYSPARRRPSGIKEVCKAGGAGNLPTVTGTLLLSAKKRKTAPPARSKRNRWEPRPRSPGLIIIVRNYGEIIAEMFCENQQPTSTAEVLLPKPLPPQPQR